MMLRSVTASRAWPWETTTWSIVHVDHPRVGVDLARDLVHGTLGGQPDAEVEELADTGFGRQEPDDPAQEAPVLHRRPAQPGHQREHLLGGDPVRLEVVLAAQVIVIHTRHVRRRHIQAQRGSLRPGHRFSVSIQLGVLACHAIKARTDRARASPKAAAAAAGRAGKSAP
jgi:hypothetical protein